NLVGALETGLCQRTEHPLLGSEAEEEMMQRLKQMPPWLALTHKKQRGKLAGSSPDAEVLMPEAAGSEPQAVPGYAILGELGRGGVGVVYQARQLGLQRPVALKMLLPGAQAVPKDLTRFRVEAAALARLQHPNIVQIYDVGEAAGQPYFVFELVAGGSLA